ncbi:MAG: hypothetical protein F7C34_01400 [Desulfurococcales archaeon]|nr:hypothetical protein [Desulfurococcales archaeon]
MSEKPRDPSRDPEVVKKMARLMMQGAVMLAERCPICGLPLFRLKSGDIVCPIHGRVMIVSSEEEADEIKLDSTIRLVEKYAASRVEGLIGEEDPSRILEWLRVIEAVERIKQLRRGAGKEERGSK